MPGASGVLAFLNVKNAKADGTLIWAVRYRSADLIPWSIKDANMDQRLFDASAAGFSILPLRLSLTQRPAIEKASP